MMDNLDSTMGSKSGWNVKVTTHFQLVSRLWMYGVFNSMVSERFCGVVLRDGGNLTLLQVL
jgi:hypothetical protein